jgi:putative transposase
MRTFEYRLYPNKQQQHLLLACLSESRHLYNEMLATLKAHYEQDGTFPTRYDLNKRFAGRGEHVPASTVQILSDRLSKALKRYLAAKELGMPDVGFPRFKKPNRWHSIQLRQHKTDFQLASDGKHLSIPKKVGGSIKIKLHRRIEGAPKTAHLVLRADGHWYVLLVCETGPQTEHGPATCSHPDIGIDVGLTSFLTDSEGHTVPDPRYFRKSQARLRRKQRTLARRKQGSHRRRKASKSTAQTHLKITRQRRDFHYQVAKRYTEPYQHIAVEYLNIEGMVKNHHLAKSIMDASWGAFLAILEDKAARAGHQVIRVHPHYTSQTCSRCGEIVQKSLSVRTHSCPICGYVEDRDVNAAKNILQVARPGHGRQELMYTDGCSIS